MTKENQGKFRKINGKSMKNFMKKAWKIELKENMKVGGSVGVWLAAAS